MPYKVESLVRGVRFRLTRRLPTREPAEVWPGIESAEVTSLPLTGQFGNVKRYELLVLCAVARHLRAQNLFEFGTFNGLTTWHLVRNCGAQCRVHTLDLPLDHPARQHDRHDRKVGLIHGVGVGGCYRDTPEAARIEQIYADSLEFDASQYRDQMDFCFIDAGHEYPWVKRDTENALLMIKPGGAIFWHDYSRWWPGVQKCLDDLSQRLPVFRVTNTALAALSMPPA